MEKMDIQREETSLRNHRVINNERDPTSRFETSQMLAAFLASTPLLSNAWRQCHAANTATPGRFVVDCIDGVAYVAFSGIQEVATGFEIFGELPTGGSNGLFSSLVDHEGEPALFQPGFLHLFSSIYNTSEFQSQILSTVNSNKAVVLTGHSIGGAIASLTTLWLLTSFPTLSSTCSLLCITFGSPLLGNEALSRVILREKWGSRFCHIVSKHDIMPRLLFSPLRSISAQLGHLLEYWHFSMRFPQQFQKPMIGLTEKEIAEFCLFVSVHVSKAATAATEQEDSVCQSSYKPFGSYLFCSREGAVCIDNPTSVIRLLHLTLMSCLWNSSIEEHLAYGDCIPIISNQFLKRSLKQGVQNSSYEAGISMALEALGMQRQDPTAGETGTCLMMARQLGCRPNLNCAKLAIRLSKVTPCRAQIEWYKAACDDYLGYYDSFQLKRSSKREFQVNINRKKLALFWDDVIDMIQKNQLPHDFHRRGKWVNASLFYKLLVEPLEISEYYRTGKHRTQGHYLVRGRERRFQIFDKWWQERNVDEDKEASTKKKRTRFAGLTQDSCFWARVEEAKECAAAARRESNISKLVVLWNNMNKFDCYARELVERKEVSRDVLAEDSSYVLWVEEWKQLKLDLAKRIPPQLPGYLGEMVSHLPTK